MEIAQAVEMFLDHRRYRSRGTQRHYRHWLTLWRNWRAWHGRPDDLSAVQIADFREFLSYLEKEHIPYRGHPHRRARPRRGLEAASVAAARRTLRTFWRFLDYEEMLSPQQSRFFGNNRIPAPQILEPPRPYCDKQTLDRLLAACGDGFDEVSARNRAIILLLYESGMRVGELCALEDMHVDLRQREAQVLGKGKQWRAVFWLPPGAVELIRYVMMRRGPRGSGYLFRGATVRNNGGQMTPDAVRSMMKRIAAEAGITLPYGCPVHWLRHSFAKRCLEAGLDQSHVGQLLGHRNPRTTERYLRDYPVRLKMIYDDAFGIEASRLARRDIQSKL